MQLIILLIKRNVDVGNVQSSKLKMRFDIQWYGIYDCNNTHNKYFLDYIYNSFFWHNRKRFTGKVVKFKQFVF